MSSAESLLRSDSNANRLRFPSSNVWSGFQVSKLLQRWKKCHLYSEVASLERPNPSHSTSDRTDLPKPIKQTKLNTLKPLNQPGNLNTIKRDI